MDHERPGRIPQWGDTIPVGPHARHGLRGQGGEFTSILLLVADVISGVFLQEEGEKDVSWEYDRAVLALLGAATRLTYGQFARVAT